jgi:hypothetical protein
MVFPVSRVFVPFCRERGSKMPNPPIVSKPILTIDIKIRFQSRIYQIRLSQVARWLVPLVIVVYRLFVHLRENAP